MDNLSKEVLTKASQIKEETNLVVMSVTYKGEPFAAICKLKELDDEHVSVKPLALVLSEEQLDHIEDIKGDHPESGLRTQLDKGEDSE